MSEIYPSSLPACFGRFPLLMKGKAANAAEMVLAAAPGQSGALACEMAAHLLDEEMTSQDTPYSFDERWAILTCAHEADDWSVENGVAGTRDPVVREKLIFLIMLATSYAQKERCGFIRYMNEAAHCARHLADIIRQALAAEAEKETQEAV